MNTINERIDILINTLNMTKTAFAESLKVSQQYISKLIRTGNPSDLLIENICGKYNVNEQWLRYGQGEMFKQRTRNQQLSEFFNNVMEDVDESYRKRFMNALSKLTVDEWKVIEKITDSLKEEG